jgi:hypothetical protein
MPNQATLGRPRRAAARDLERAAACLLIIVLAVAGCGASDGAPARHPRPQSDSATPVPSPTVTAADGTDVSACDDGNCEILVSGPVVIHPHRHGGITKLSVTEVGSSGLGYKTESIEGSGTGDIGPGCTVTVTQYGEGSECTLGQNGSPQPPPQKQTGVLTMQITAATKDGVVLRLVSGEVGPPPASLSPPSLQ